MALFKINGLIVRKLATEDLDLEKHLQSLFEKNLDELLNITFLAHEYSTSRGGRIDTLGIDKNGSPCIIEYKRNQNDNVINQGLSYLLWLLDHKANFEIICRDAKVGIAIDWDSPRVICIAESYNKFDLDTVDLLPINIELLCYRIYDENILYLEPEDHQKTRVPTSNIFKKNKLEKEKGVELQKSYSIDQHLVGVSKIGKELFQIFRERVLSLDEAIREEPMKFYIAYKLTTNFVDVAVHKNGLKIFLNVKSGHLKDPGGFARNMEKPKHIGHQGNGDYEIKLENREDVDAVLALVKQSYDLNK